MTRPLRSPQRIAELWRRYADTRDPEARTELLDQYLGLVHHAARSIIRQSRTGLDLDDLVSAGTVGLVHALEQFDPDRGFAFSTFAVPRIRGAILDEIRSWDWVPRSVRETERDLKRSTDALRQELGREPEAHEAAAALDLSVDEYLKRQAQAREPVVLPLDGGGDGEEGGGTDILPDPSGPSSPEEMSTEEVLMELDAAFQSLSERDRLILNLSYYEHLTLREIGEVLHVTESRVSQLRARALKRLLERSGLADRAGGAAEPQEKAA